MNERQPISEQHASKRLAFFLFVAVLIPILIVLIWYVAHRWSDASAIRQLEAKARKNGEPLTYPELAALYPPIPDNQNGAALLMDAWEKDNPMYWRLFREGEQHFPETVSKIIDPAVPYVGTNSPPIQRTNDIEAANLKAAEAYLRERNQHLRDIRTALANSNFWFPLNISNGEPPILIHLAQLKGEALNFSVRALVSSEHGDLDSAISAIEDTAHTGNALVTEPLTVSQFVRLACYHIALSDSERLLSRRTLSPAQLNRLARLCAEIRVGGGPRLALFSERVGFLSNLDDLERNPIVKVVIPMQFSRRTVLTECDHLLSLGDPYTPQVLREYDSLNDKVMKFREDTNALVTRTLGWSLLGSMETVAHKFAIFEIHRRAAITALAVEQHRIEHQGNLPKQLNDPVPKYLKELPLNPIDGKPLRFQHLPVGFVVYSVNFDGVDDGWDLPRHRDMIFEVQR